MSHNNKTANIVRALLLEAALTRITGAAPETGQAAAGRRFLSLHRHAFAAGAASLDRHRSQVRSQGAYQPLAPE